MFVYTGVLFHLEQFSEDWADFTKPKLLPCLQFIMDMDNEQDQISQDNFLFNISPY